MEDKSAVLWCASLPGCLTRGEIDFKTNGSEAKAEYVVAPGFSSAEIRLRFDGDAEIQADGSLLVSGATGQFREQRPFLFQDLASGRRAVEGGFRKYDDGTIGFTTGTYDRKQPLVIDPVLLFSGYLGEFRRPTSRLSP